MINRRAQLIDAAEAVFARRGYADATMADIAKEAGVTRPTVYAYFDSKHDALRQVAERVQHEFITLQDQSADTPAETLQLTVTAYVRQFVRHYGLLTVISHQALSDREFSQWLDAIHTRTNKRHAKYLRILAEAGEATLAVPPETIAEVVTGATLRYAQLIMLEPHREQEYIDALVSAHLHLLGLSFPVRPGG